MVDVEKERRRLSYLATDHYWQENPVVRLPNVVVAMVMSFVLLLSLNLLGSTLIGAGVLLTTAFVTAATVFIWFVDVAVWQHHDDHRIDPTMLAEDIAESIEQNGVNETLERAYPWDR